MAAWGEGLKQRLEAAGLSQKWLALRMKASQATLSLWLAGKQRSSPWQRLQIGQLLTAAEFSHKEVP